MLGRTLQSSAVLSRRRTIQIFEIPQKRNAVTVLKIANIFTEEEKSVVKRERNTDYRRSALGDGDSTDGGDKDSSSNFTVVRKRNRNWEALSSSSSSPSNTLGNQSSNNHNNKKEATEQDNNVNGLRVVSSLELQVRFSSLFPEYWDMFFLFEGVGVKVMFYIIYL